MTALYREARSQVIEASARDVSMGVPTLADVSGVQVTVAAAPRRGTGVGGGGGWAGASGGRGAEPLRR